MCGIGEVLGMGLPVERHARVKADAVTAWIVDASDAFDLRRPEGPRSFNGHFDFLPAD
jgi:hypothetical protein